MDHERINPVNKVIHTDKAGSDRKTGDSRGGFCSDEIAIESSKKNLIQTSMESNARDLENQEGNSHGDVDDSQIGLKCTLNDGNEIVMNSCAVMYLEDMKSPERNVHGNCPGDVNDSKTVVKSSPIKHTQIGINSCTGKNLEDSDGTSPRDVLDSQTVMDVMNNQILGVTDSYAGNQVKATESCDYRRCTDDDFKINCIDDFKINYIDDESGSDEEELKSKTCSRREIMFLEGFEDNEPFVVSMTVADESNSGLDSQQEKDREDKVTVRLNSSKEFSDWESDSGSEISDGEWERLNQAFSARQFEETSDLTKTTEIHENLSCLGQNLNFTDQNVFDSLTGDGIGDSDDVILVGTEIGSLHSSPASRYFPSKQSKYFAEQDTSIEKTPSHADVEQHLLKSFVSEGKFLQKKNPKKNTMAKIFNLSRMTSVNPSPSDSLKCSVCSAMFAEKTSLQNHMKRHKGTKTNYLKCSQCPRVFSTKYTLAMHERIHSDFRPFHCNVCGKGFYQRANIKVHMRAHTGERPFKCNICGKAYTVKLSLAAHSGTHVQENRYACKKCKFCFSTEADLENHQQVHAIQRTHECPKCKKKFLKAYLLEFHLQRDCAEKRFVCKYCNKAFTHLDYLKVHQRVHTGEKPFGCEVCGKFFSQSANLTKHLKIHNNIRDFACDLCDATFIEKASMISHRRTHTGEKPHMCDICGMAFSSPSSLVIHIRVHTGEKPYACDMCDKRFNSSGKLRDHKRTHTGEKPYKCKYCERRFALSNGLVRHTRIHTGERPHKCDVCGMRFIRKDRMKKHRLSHGDTKEGILPYEEIEQNQFVP